MPVVPARFSHKVHGNPEREFRGHPREKIARFQWKMNPAPLETNAAVSWTIQKVFA